METKHTPGPIEIRRTHPTHKGIAYIYPVNGGVHSDSCTQEMAAFYLADEGSRNEANALHMVQCWNSYDALVEALEWFPVDADHCNSEEFRGACTKWWEIYARPAIALATGSEVAK